MRSARNLRLWLWSAGVTAIVATLVATLGLVQQGSLHALTFPFLFVGLAVVAIINNTVHIDLTSDDWIVIILITASFWATVALLLERLGAWIMPLFRSRAAPDHANVRLPPPSHPCLSQSS